MDLPVNPGNIKIKTSWFLFLKLGLWHQDKEIPGLFILFIFSSLKIISLLIGNFDANKIYKKAF